MNGRAQIGGILSMVAGGFGVLTGIGLAALTMVIVNLFNTQGFAAEPMSDEVIMVLRLMYGGMGVFYALIGALAVVGGIMAVKRKHWGLALAGAIAATITFFPVGIASIIFISMSHAEFAKSVAPTTTTTPPTPAG